jgi:hypothetical protein
MNSIPDLQNDSRRLRYLAAARCLYSRSKVILGVSVVLSVPVVMCASVLAILWEPFAPYSALLAVVVTLVNVLVVGPCRRRLSVTAAKAQEVFDVDVFGLPWNSLKVGSRPAGEEIAAAAREYSTKQHGFDALRDWYPLAVGALPIEIARIACQRASCMWDQRLRVRYTGGLVVGVIILVVVASVVGLVTGWTLANLLLWIIVPAMPALLLSIGEYQRHGSQAKANARLSKEAQRLLEAAIDGWKSHEELSAGSRALQDEIFRRRSSPSLVFDWLYQRFRKGDEEDMNETADEFVARYQRSHDAPIRAPETGDGSSNVPA